jgi:hypothetical protein
MIDATLHGIAAHCTTSQGADVSEMIDTMAVPQL